MKFKILTTNLMLLFVASFANAAEVKEPTNIKEMAASYFPTGMNPTTGKGFNEGVKGKNYISALNGFENYYKPSFFNSQYMQLPRYLRNAKTYLNYVAILLSLLSESFISSKFGAVTIDDLPTAVVSPRDPSEPLANIRDQTKTLLTRYNLELRKIDNNWHVLPAGIGGVAPSTAEVTALKKKVTDLEAQLASRAPTGPEPANLQQAIDQATDAAKAVRAAYTTYTGADKDRVAKPGIQGISTALITPAL